ncbi:hypothetical protein BJ166DRAFT_587040 [Pestalotiopsis sp. NC0098]|nr:hypothetical protein BJ166DRAFT_587040 [Pestalotiopsis sp. NC0098]
MTKAWEAYEAIIKDLYAKHTLATVRDIMLNQYGFNASVRAYRQKLDAWGCTKYKRRDRAASRSSPGDGPPEQQHPPAQQTTRTTPRQGYYQDQTAASRNRDASYDTSTAAAATSGSVSYVLPPQQQHNVGMNSSGWATSASYPQQPLLSPGYDTSTSSGFAGDQNSWYSYQVSSSNGYNYSGVPQEWGMLSAPAPLEYSRTSGERSPYPDEDEEE